MEIFISTTRERRKSNIYHITNIVVIEQAQSLNFVIYLAVSILHRSVWNVTKLCVLWGIPKQKYHHQNPLQYVKFGLWLNMLTNSSCPHHLVLLKLAVGFVVGIESLTRRYSVSSLNHTLDQTLKTKWIVDTGDVPLIGSCIGREVLEFDGASIWIVQI